MSKNVRVNPESVKYLKKKQRRAKKGTIPFHVAQNYNSYHLDDGTKFWARDDEMAEDYKVYVKSYGKVDVYYSPNPSAITPVGGDETDIECPECDSKMVISEFGDASSDISTIGLQCDFCGYKREEIK